jgi:hypothetical protein
MVATLHRKSRSVARAKLLVGSALVVAGVLAMLASTASARYLSFGGATSQPGGRAQVTMVARLNHHKIRLSVTGLTVSASFTCADGSVTPILADPQPKTGPMNRKGYFSGTVPVNPGGSQTVSGQVTRNLRSISGTFQANYADPTHGRCDTGPVTWTATVGG